MEATWLFLSLLPFSCYGRQKHPKPWTQVHPAPKYDNPAQVKDRDFNLEEKAYAADKSPFRPALLPEKWLNRFRKPFHPSWMDYCDPYHCNDYHKTVCGLNRKNMKFKWFQSSCHVALNNACNVYRGTLQYDVIDTKFCAQYGFYARTSCTLKCDDEVAPVCAVSGYDNHVVVFKNVCYLEKINCKLPTFNEYEEVHMDICRNTLDYEKVKRE